MTTPSKHKFSNKTLLLSFALAPLLGSITLLATIYLLFFSLLAVIRKGHKTQTERPFKLVGLIFITYFCLLALLETLHAPTVTIQIRELGKIFPIFALGVLAYLQDGKILKLTYRSVSDTAIIGIYMTVITALLVRSISPQLPMIFEPFIEELNLYGRLTLGAGNALPMGTLLITICFITLIEISKKMLQVNL